MHPFACGQCGHTVFFENSQCGQCQATLGFLPAAQRMAAWQPQGTLWQGLGNDAGRIARACANRLDHGVCNWMLDDDDANPLCRSCRLTQVIPDLSVAGNLGRWHRIEQAKRRLVFTLAAIGLPLQQKRGGDDAHGLAFRLLAPVAGGAPVLTGHDCGVITLSLMEADDAHGEATRVAMGEPTRNLLGHLRHETAHYLQYRLIDHTPAAEVCRAVFGDERSDYAAALSRHYQQGPPPGWQQHFVSAYASAHPWEDWAETCAHYLLVVDAVQTAASWGLRLDGPAQATPNALDPGQPPPVEDLVLCQWLPVAQFLNAMNRSLGQRDSYPFLLPPAVLHKLRTVQQLLQGAAP